MRTENIPINGPIFKDKAQEFAEQLNLEDFHTSEFREENIFIFLTHLFSTRAPNNIFKYAQIHATYKMTKFSKAG